MKERWIALHSLKWEGQGSCGALVELTADAKRVIKTMAGNLQRN